MPSVHDVLILVRAYVAEEDDLPWTFALSSDYFTNGWHPAPDEAIVDLPLPHCLLESSGVLAGMIRSRASPTVNRSNVVGLFRSYECSPHSGILLGRCHRRRRRSHRFRIRIAFS